MTLSFHGPDRRTAARLIIAATACLVTLVEFSFVGQIEAVRLMLHAGILA